MSSEIPFGDDSPLPRVDVVILTWNDAQLLRTAIDSVLLSQGVDARVIVVDNASWPAAEPPDDRRLHLVHNETNRGVAAGRNRGVACTSAPIICLLDSDARLAPDCLRNLVDVLDEDAAIGLAGPVFTDQVPEASAGLAPTFGRKVSRVASFTGTYAPSQRGAAPAWWPVDFCIGACQCFRRSAYDSIDGIDESFFYGPEDADFCMRLRLRGWRIVQVAAARCEHPPRRHSRRLFTRRGARHALAVVRFLARHSRFRARAGQP